MSQAVRNVELHVFERGLLAGQAKLSMADGRQLAAEADGHLILEENAELLEIAASQRLPSTFGDGDSRHGRRAAVGMSQVLTDAEEPILGADVELRQQEVAGQ